MTAITLTTAQRSALRGLAHGLPVTVHIGQGGVTPAVLKEVDIALGVHGLIKVRVLVAEREERAAMLDTLADSLFCAPVQHIGRMLVLWRARPEDAMPAAVPAKTGAQGVAGRSGAARGKLGVRADAGRAPGSRSGSTRSRGEGFETRAAKPRAGAAALSPSGSRPPRPSRTAGADGFAADRPRVPRRPVAAAPVERPRAPRRDGEDVAEARPRVPRATGAMTGQDRPRGGRPARGRDDGLEARPKARAGGPGTEHARPVSEDRERGAGYATERPRRGGYAADKPRNPGGRTGAGAPRPASAGAGRSGPGRAGPARGGPGGAGGSGRPRKPGRD